MKKHWLILLALAMALGVIVFLRWDRTPRLDRPRFEEARRLWEKNGPASYDLELVVEGDRTIDGRYRVEVRAGRAVRFERDGQEVTSPSSAAGYTVPGLLDVIDRELEMAAGPRVPGAPQRAVLKGTFDERYGYPTVFKRLAPLLQSRFIRIERFTPLGS